MDVSRVGFGSATAEAGESQQKTPQDQFLTLLVAQLEHQNPLSPQDSAQFVAQLAQFTQVEQTAQTNKQLEGLQAAEAAGLRASFSTMVGREITAVSDRVTVQDGEVGDAQYNLHLDGPAKKVEIVVRNADGEEVRRMEMSNLLSGETEFTWDGKNAHGVKVADGDYTFEVTAENEGGDKVEVHTRIRGRATAIDFDGGAIHFTVGSAEITPADIIAIAE